MIWYLIHQMITFLWDSFRFSHLSPDAKTLELLLLRQHCTFCIVIRSVDPQSRTVRNSSCSLSSSMYVVLPTYRKGNWSN